MNEGMLRYTGCGLDNVYLRNGYEVYTMASGEEAVQIQDLAGLHRAIATVIVDSTAPFDAKTFKFLRKEQDMSQRQLARILGVEEQTVSLWERARQPIPQSADLLLRGLVKECLSGNAELQKMVDRANSLDRDLRDIEMRIELLQKDGHWSQLEAA